MNTVELTVVGMTCGSCVKHVKRALQAVRGVANVEVDLENGRAIVNGDLHAGSAPLIDALAKENYAAIIKNEASPVKATAKSGCMSHPGKSGGCCCG